MADVDKRSPTDFFIKFFVPAAGVSKAGIKLARRVIDLKRLP